MLFLVENIDSIIFVEYSLNISIDVVNKTVGAHGMSDVIRKVVHEFLSFSHGMAAVRLLRINDSHRDGQYLQQAEHHMKQFTRHQGALMEDKE